jgi:hypothetical protein
MQQISKPWTSFKNAAQRINSACRCERISNCRNSQRPLKLGIMCAASRIFDSPPQPRHQHLFRHLPPHQPQKELSTPQHHVDDTRWKAQREKPFFCSSNCGECLSPGRMASRLKRWRKRRHLWHEPQRLPEQWLHHNQIHAAGTEEDILGPTERRTATIFLQAVVSPPTNIATSLLSNPAWHQSQPPPPDPKHRL